MGHLFLLPDVCEPPKAKSKTSSSNKRPRPKANNEDEQRAAAPAASDSDVCSQCASEHARAQNNAPDSASASRSDDLESLLSSLEEERAASPRQGASWGRAIHGADERSAQSSTNSSMSSFRGGRGSSSATRTSSKRSRTTVCVGWSSLRDDEEDM